MTPAPLPPLFFILVAGCGAGIGSPEAIETEGPDAEAEPPHQSDSQTSYSEDCNCCVSDCECTPPCGPKDRPLEDRIRLPIEVFGSGLSSVEISIDIVDATGVDTLFLQAHRIGYEEGLSDRVGEAKASVKINEHPWLPITNDTVDLHEPERSYGGIGGGYHTVRFTIPVRGIRAGVNTLVFRFNGTDQITSGYRILALNFLRGGHPVLAASRFYDDDPRNWESPSTVSSDIEAGERWWHQRDLLKLPNGDPLSTACADCHAQDGRDLKYFNYSNESIIQRSVFHGLSLKQGASIASYIRTLDVPSPARARPWNPPYQPGPGMDAQPKEAWAAGAGLSAVLERDQDMFPYLKPPGTSWSEVAHTEQTLNLRQMPIAVQLPDWNAWLPHVHPLDAWGSHFTGGVAHAKYQALRKNLPALVAEPTAALITSVGNLDDGARQFISRGRTDDTGGGNWRTRDGATIDTIAPGLSREQAKLGLAKWLGVKHWELIQEYGLEQLPSVVAPPIRGIQYGEALGWPSDGQSVWANAPHMTADNKRNYAGQSEVVGLFQSSVWYQLQMLLNSGMRLGWDTRPVDWSYHFRFIRLLAEKSGQPQSLRFFQSKIKAYQARDNGHGPVNYGWQHRFLHPWQLYSDDRGDRTLHAALDDIRPGLWVEVFEAITSAAMDTLETKPEYDLTQWPRRAPGDSSGRWWKLEGADHRPADWTGSGDLFDQPSYNHADAYYRLLPRLKSVGVSQALLQRIANWCAAAWPNGDWMRRMD